MSGAAIRRGGWLAALWLGAVASPAAGQVALAAPVAEPGAELSVALVTIGAGGRVYERFGHNMLWIRSAAAPLDSVWDWGRFSFRTERFFIRFAQGDLRYWMAGDDGPRQIQSYAATGRTVRVQELALTPAQRLQLLEFVRSNDTETNRYYQYHYYLDNCSTRIRDALDLVLGGALRARTDTALTPWTYRDETRRLNQHNPLLYFGLTALLAEWTDRRMTGWEEMFLPSGVERWVRELEVPAAAPGGGMVPLVARDEVIAAGGRYPVPDRPGRWWPGFLAIGLVLMGLLAATGRTRSGVGRVFVPLAMGYALIAGLLGLTMALLWAVSGHEVAWRNENLWQFNLAALALLPLIPSARRGHGRNADAAYWLAIAIAGCSLFGVAMKVFSEFGQDNWEVIALALPANLGLALGVIAVRHKP